MKKVILILALCVASNMQAQIDVSMETSLVGFETAPVVDLAYPMGKATLGASLGYYIYPTDYKQRITGLAGYEIINNVHMEATFGVIRAFDEYHLTGSLGAKTILNNNFFVKGAIAYPGLIRASIGYRFDVFK